MRFNIDNFEQLLTALMTGEYSEAPTQAPEDIILRRERSYMKFVHGVNAHSTIINIYVRALKYACVLCLVVGVAFHFEYHGRNSVMDNLAHVTIEAPLRSTVKTTLPDGSKVWLNAGSRLTYSQDFGLKERKILLEGEGYFEVTHNAEKPFSVNSSCINVTVLGTKFNFCDYAEDAIATVSLLEGSVKIQGTASSSDINGTVLAPDQRCTVNKTDYSMTIEKMSTQGAKNWTSGQLFFDNERLASIVQKLTRLYGKKVHVANPQHSDICYYGVFSLQDDNLETIIDGITNASDLHYRVSKNEIIIY